jgi:hypothetical protein
VCSLFRYRDIIQHSLLLFSRSPYRCTIQLGPLYESQVLPSASCQTSAVNGRSTPAVWDACINGGLFPGGRARSFLAHNISIGVVAGNFWPTESETRFDAVAGLRPWPHYRHNMC